MLQVFRRIWCILSSNSRFQTWVLRPRPGLLCATPCGSLASNVAPNPTTVIIGHRNPGFRTCTYEGTLVTDFQRGSKRDHVEVFYVEVFYSAHPRIRPPCPLRPVRDRRDRGMARVRALAGRRLARVQVRLRRGGRRHRSGPAIRRASLRRRHDLRARVGRTRASPSIAPYVVSSRAVPSGVPKRRDAHGGLPASGWGDMARRSCAGARAGSPGCSHRHRLGAYRDPARGPARDLDAPDATGYPDRDGIVWAARIFAPGRSPAPATGWGRRWKRPASVTGPPRTSALIKPTD